MLGRSVIPSCWLFGTRCPALESAGSCVEPGLGVNVGTSGRTHADYYSLGPGILWWPNILDLTHLPRLDSWSGNQEAHKLFSMKEKKEKRKRKQRQAKPKTNDKNKTKKKKKKIEKNKEKKKRKKKP